jgi:hypothetical protein
LPCASVLAESTTVSPDVLELYQYILMGTLAIPVVEGDSLMEPEKVTCRNDSLFFLQELIIIRATKKTR